MEGTKMVSKACHFVLQIRNDEGPEELNTLEIDQQVNDNGEELHDEGYEGGDQYHSEEEFVLEELKETEPEDEGDK
jgi:hypothetical protein